jgi:NAD(P)-dependent dehydrogenase (short-subunit alcohol dehydrogenase family)
MIETVVLTLDRATGRLADQHTGTVPTAPDLSFFVITAENMEGAFGLNYMTTVIPSQVVGKRFADHKPGVILNIASIGGVRPLTRSIGYSNAKAAVATLGVAVHGVPFLLVCVVDGTVYLHVPAASILRRHGYGAG